nr:hypothetical protein Iba_chr04eCG10200 [Ipomoea batatas]
MEVGGGIVGERVVEVWSGVERESAEVQGSREVGAPVRLWVVVVDVRRGEGRREEGEEYARGAERLVWGVLPGYEWRWVETGIGGLRRWSVVGLGGVPVRVCGLRMFCKQEQGRGSRGEAIGGGDGGLAEGCLSEESRAGVRERRKGAECAVKGDA